MSDNHIKLINALCEIEDIRYTIMGYVDYEEMRLINERRQRIKNAKRSRRWRRLYNTYDTHKFNDIGR
jgi:hypothetical protein